MKNNFLYAILLFFPIISYSQFNNSQKQTILNLQNGDFKFLKLSGGETSFETNFRKREIYSGEDVTVDSLNKNEIKDLFYRKNSALNLKAGITNIGKFIDLKNLDFEDKGFLLSLSYVNSFKQLVVREKQNGEFYVASPFPINPFSIGMQIKMDNFDRYDPVENRIIDSKPITASIFGSWTHLYFGKDRRINALSINGQFDAVTYDESEFSSNFKRFSDITNINDQVVTFDAFDGKFGRLENNVQRYQLSVSYAFLSRSKPNYNSKLFITPIPYLSLETISGGKVYASTINGKPKTTFGMIAGISTKSVFSKVQQYGDDKNEKPIELNMVDGSKVLYRNNYKFRDFVQPSFIYIGIDNTMRNGAKPELNFFLAGSFSFD